jgi:hypothetical protein
MLREIRLGRAVLRFAMVIGVIALVGCSSGVGNDGDVVGGPCPVNHSCAPGSLCLTGEVRPGGYCSVSCSDDEGCVGGTECVQQLGNYCLVSCTSDADCRSDEGYECLELPRAGAAGTTTVCAAR